MKEKLEIDDTAALALFEFLSRTLDEQDGEKLKSAVVHDGELWALNALHATLEKSLSEPLEAEYRAKVETARELLVTQADPWPKTPDYKSAWA